MTTLCLSMIVKNNEQIIEKTLENLCSKFKFDYWVILDTGSVDNTKKIINDFFSKNDISGELIENAKDDKNLALSYTYQKTDFVLVSAVNDNLIGIFNKSLNPDIDLYMVFDSVYYKPLILN